MANENGEIKKGDTVEVIISVWSDDERPTAQNFYRGKIQEIVERTTHCYYVKLEGYNRLIPVDRVRVS